MAEKSDQAEIEKRVTEIYGLIIRGRATREIVHYAAREWGVAERQAKDYISKAQARINQVYAQKRNRMLQEIIARHGDMRDNNYISDPRLVLDIDKEDAKLLGLYPTEETKITVTHKGYVGISPDDWPADNTDGKPQTEE